MSKINVAIIGATGFTGSELVRILVNHPNVEIVAITSESRAGEMFSDVHPQFFGIYDKKLISTKALDKSHIDVAFLALPHGVSMRYVEDFAHESFKIIDLSGDFRLADPKTYKDWYKMDHSYKSGFDKAVYGLPELYKEQIKTATLVANPGCFPTSAILGLAPLLASSLVETDRIIIDSKTGVTGAGIKPSGVNMYSNVNENFKAYGLKHHRHTIEIEENGTFLSGKDMRIQFTPHLLPVDRGILSTIYLRPNKEISNEEVKQVFETYYQEAPFVRVRNTAPSIKEVRGTNYCDVFCTVDERTGNIIVISAIDNLVKGAAGQAVHNMNLMFAIEETAGLKLTPFIP